MAQSLCTFLTRHRHKNVPSVEDARSFELYPLLAIAHYVLISKPHLTHDLSSPLLRARSLSLSHSLTLCIWHSQKQFTRYTRMQFRTHTPPLSLIAALYRYMHTRSRSHSRTLPLLPSHLLTGNHVRRLPVAPMNVWRRGGMGDVSDSLNTHECSVGYSSQ